MKNIENEKIGKIVAQMDINLDDIVTYRTVTRVLMSMIEFLSFNRNQIPMVFETFTHLTSNLEKQQLQQNSDDCPEMKNFALDRQRELVITTNQNFRDMSNIIAKSCKDTELEQAIVAFGATVFTLKEAYVVNLPQLSKLHSAQNHVDSPQTITRKVIMSIISNSDFFEVNSSALKATNMFLFLKPKHSEHLLSDTDFDQHAEITIPPTCRTTVFNIESCGDDTSQNCCKNLNVYNDKIASTSEIPDQKVEDKVECTDLLAKASSYFVCKVSVKGFKNQPVKGASVWSQ